VIGKRVIERGPEFDDAATHIERLDLERQHLIVVGLLARSARGSGRAHPA
jgi:hypothetical protein